MRPEFWRVINEAHEILSEDAMTITFNPETYKRTTRQQWQDAAEAASSRLIVVSIPVPRRFAAPAGGGVACCHVLDTIRT